MLTQNRFGKYLIYATGEIILVIIGILIALQINNWNEKKKIEQELLSSLKAMIEELDENIQFLSKERQGFEVRLQRTKKLKNNKASDKDMEEIINYMGQDVNSRPFRKVFELIKENKQLQLIQNKELVKKMNQFYEFTLPDLDKLSNWHDRFVSNNIDTYILENIPLENGISDPNIVKHLMTQLKFKNILTYQEMIYDGYIKRCNYTIQQAQELQKDLTSYLNNK